MKLSEESYLVDLLGFIKEDEEPITDWEEGFMADQAERFADKGSEMWMSPAQMNIVRRVGSQRYGMVWEDYDD